MEDKNRRLSAGESVSSGRNGSISSHGSSVSPTAQSDSHQASLTGSPKRSAVVVSVEEKREIQSSLKEVKRLSWYVRVSRWFCQSKLFALVTTILTLYALTGDDFRTLLAPKSADPVFDICVLVCIVVFSWEVLVNCLGKADYFLSFYFGLDAVSTLTLVLDLTWVADGIQANVSNTNLSSSRSGRTARIGAKAARVVRVLRLVRILKLYKAYFEAREKRKRREREAKLGYNPGEDDDWEDAELEEHVDEDKNDAKNESRVGKKLSEMTTRRTICLVLAMLIVLPVLQAQSSSCSSAEFGVDLVFQRYQAYVNNPDPMTKKLYNHAMLMVVLYHNWFAKWQPATYCNQDEWVCQDMFEGQLFWFGIRGKNMSVIEAETQRTVLDNVWVNHWSEENLLSDSSFHFGGIPYETKVALASPWNHNCTLDGDLPILQGISLIAPGTPGTGKYAVQCPGDLRLGEMTEFNPRLLRPDDESLWKFAFFFDIRSFVWLDAQFGLFTTLFVLLLLVVWAMIFSYDANRLVLYPVEKMIKRVLMIRANPLIAMKLADEEFKAEEVAKARMKRHRRERLKFLIGRGWNALFGGNDDTMETVVLEKTILKLGSLLVLGFGEAGGNMISQNMTSSDASINVMVPGRHVDCIMGVIRVRTFSIATEVLQAKIMTFVNQIAEVVHGIANEFHGAPNRNSGDNFLVVWQIPKGSEALESRLAEMSIVACAKILGALHRSPLLADYRTHPGLQNRLGKDARVNLSFGLHAGWAIEGAVGTEFKIDASYLSPNVSIATSVERATQFYGVSLIASQAVLERCSHGLLSKCRKIDRVIISGSTQPIELFCVDLDYMSVTVDNTPPSTMAFSNRNRLKARQFLEAQKLMKLHEDVDMATLFNDDPIIQLMRRRYTSDFLELFNMGCQNYFEGEWQVARRMLSRTRTMLDVEDGPSQALLRYMEVTFQFEAPKEWQGYRDMEAWEAWFRERERQTRADNRLATAI